MTPTATFLIGTSLSEGSDEVVRAGLALARAAGAKIHLLHAFAQPMAYGGAPFISELPLEEVIRQEGADLRHLLEDQVRRVGARPEDLAGITVELGPPHRALVAAARDLDAGLVVVGSSESPRLARLFGSTADRVVRKCGQPVFVVRCETVLPPRRVLLPVDLSLLSAAAFHEGLAFLGRVAPGSGTEVEALFVLSDAEREGLTAAEGSLMEAERRARRDLERFVETNNGSRAVAVRLAVGPVERSLLAHIEEWRPDLVVIGTHGRGGFERFLLGSVAARVIREAESNILVLPPAPARKAARDEEKTADREIKEEAHVVIHG